MIDASDTPPPARIDRAAELVASLLFVAAYIIWVSRGEVLPYDGLARSLTVPVLVATLSVMVAWRMRWRLARFWYARQVWRWALAGAGLGVAVALRLLVGGVERPITSLEASVLADALQLMRERSPAATDPITLALAWLHLPTASFAYLAGVSAGWWVDLHQTKLDGILPFARGLHLIASILTVPLVGLAAARLGGPTAGWLAAWLLALGGSAIQAAVTIDTNAPLGLILALALLAAAVGIRRRPRRLPRPVLIGLAALGLAGLWLPTPFGAALAPLAALIAGLALVALPRPSPAARHEPPAPVASTRSGGTRRPTPET